MHLYLCTFLYKSVYFYIHIALTHLFTYIPKTINRYTYSFIDVFSLFIYMCTCTKCICIYIYIYKIHIIIYIYIYVRIKLYMYIICEWAKLTSGCEVSNLQLSPVHIPIPTYQVPYLFIVVLFFYISISLYLSIPSSLYINIYVSYRIRAAVVQY